MNLNLLSAESQEFISQNAEKDPTLIALSKISIHGVTATELANQINSKKKAEIKWPEWANHSLIYWPPTLSVEQSSSELASKIRFEEQKGNLAIDLTGGAGIDAWTLSKSFKRVIYVEKQPELCDIAQYNFSILGSGNIEIVNSSAEEFLNNCPYADLIFIDPSRRTTKGKVFQLSECEPDVTQLQKIISSKCSHWIVKNSPLLDIQSLLNDIGGVTKIRSLAIGNEVKELVAEVYPDSTIITFEAVNTSPNSLQRTLTFVESEKTNLKIKYGDPSGFVYEPNAAIMKLNAADICATRFQCNKIAPNSQLLTSEELIENFPGKTFQMLGYLSSNAKSIRRSIPDNRAAIFVRNYPLKANLLRKKLKLEEGEKDFVVGTTLQNGKKVLLHLQKLM